MPGSLAGWLVVLFFYGRTGHKTERLTILHAATHETERGDHDLCLSRSHYTDTDRTSAFTCIESRALSTEVPRPQCMEC